MTWSGMVVATTWEPATSSDVPESLLWPVVFPLLTRLTGFQPARDRMRASFHCAVRHRLHRTPERTLVCGTPMVEPRGDGTSPGEPLPRGGTGQADTDNEVKKSGAVRIPLHRSRSGVGRSEGMGKQGDRFARLRQRACEALRREAYSRTSTPYEPSWSLPFQFLRDRTPCFGPSISMSTALRFVLT